MVKIETPDTQEARTMGVIDYSRVYDLLMRIHSATVFQPHEQKEELMAQLRGIRVLIEREILRR